MAWFPDSVTCLDCGEPIHEGGAERCSACAPKRPSKERIVGHIFPHHAAPPSKVRADCFEKSGRVCHVVIFNEHREAFGYLQRGSRFAEVRVYDDRGYCFGRAHARNAGIA
jgi:hypothetical protein